MIIGNNSNNFNNNMFTNKFNRIKSEGEKNKDIVNPQAIDKKALFNGNTNNKQQMADKTFAMLQDRYNNGTITLEEFTKQCELLNKRRQN